MRHVVNICPLHSHITQDSFPKIVMATWHIPYTRQQYLLLNFINTEDILNRVLCENPAGWSDWSCLSRPPFVEASDWAMVKRRVAVM